MPRDGSGTYTRTDGVVSGSNVMQQQRDTIGTIDAPRHDAHDNDIGQALTDSIAKNGVTVATADLPMGGFKHTNVANGSLRNHYTSIGQVQDGAINFAICTGTGDAMVASFTPAITAVVDGQQFRVRAVGANTVTTPTFQVGATTARTIVKAGGQALTVGDYTAGMEIILRYVAGGTPVYELLTPVQADTSTFVPSSRQVNADGSSLSGGGDLTADRTISAILASQVEAETGTDNAKLMTALRVAQSIAANAQVPIFTGSNSGDIATITVNSTHNFAHGHGKIPELFVVYLECTTADLGYAVGERVKIDGHGSNALSDVNFTVSADATNIKIRVGTLIQLLSGSYSWASITPASWKFHIRTYIE